MEKRPNVFSNEVCEAAAEQMFPRVKDWLGEEAHTSEEETYIKGQIAAAIKMGELDAYRIARHLDDTCGWAVNGELVEIFNGIIPIQYGCLDQQVEQWVWRNRVAAKYSAGDTIGFNRKGYKQGVVTEVNYRLGTYTVFCAALGHVDRGRGVTGIILTFEEVHDSNRDAPVYQHRYSA